MADLSNSSFIPKRGPVKRKRVSSSRQVYVFTLVSYILMFATLIGAGGVFFYSKHIDNNLNTEISNLNTAIKSFSELDMKRVQDFDSRLSQATGRLNNSVSIVSVFEALEAATVDTVKIDSLSSVRELDNQILIEAAIETDSFDSTIFQRGVYQRNQTVEEITISEIQNNLVADNTNKTPNSTSERSALSFKAELRIPLSEIPYVVRQVNDSNEALNSDSGLQIDNDFFEEAGEGMSSLEGNQTDI